MERSPAESGSSAPPVLEEFSRRDSLEELQDASEQRRTEELARAFESAKGAAREKFASHEQETEAAWAAIERYTDAGVLDRYLAALNNAYRRYFRSHQEHREDSARYDALAGQQRMGVLLLKRDIAAARDRTYAAAQVLQVQIDQILDVESRIRDLDPNAPSLRTLSTPEQVAEWRRRQGVLEHITRDTGVPPEHICFEASDIDERTRVYVGKPFRGMFQHLKHVERVYTAYPGEPLERVTMSVGTESADTLSERLRAEHGVFVDHTLTRVAGTHPTAEDVDVVILRARDIYTDGLPEPVRYESVISAAGVLGLRPCRKDEVLSMLKSETITNHVKPLVFGVKPFRVFYNTDPIGFAFDTHTIRYDGARERRAGVTKLGNIDPSSQYFVFIAQRDR